MKNTIISFALGILATLCIAANTNTNQSVVPAIPRQVLVLSFRTMFGLEDDMKKAIDKYVAQGWIVKSVAMMDDETWSKGIVVLEKY